MKKCFLLFMLLFITACYNDTTLMNNSIKVDEPTVTVPEYIDENPVTVGLYQDGKLINSINTSFNNKTDITVVDVYFTNEENVLSTNTKKNFSKYASNYQDVSKYKIGFIVSFSVSDEFISKIITGPKDTYILSPYVYTYLYDDVHQSDGSWYSHVTEEDVNDDTIYSSIKLYGAWDADKITSPIELTVFTYDTDDDFDEEGMYRGNSKYTITIKSET